MLEEIVVLHSSLGCFGFFETTYFSVLSNIDEANLANTPERGLSIFIEKKKDGKASAICHFLTEISTHINVKMMEASIALNISKTSNCIFLHLVSTFSSKSLNEQACYPG